MACGARRISNEADIDERGDGVAVVVERRGEGGEEQTSKQAGAGSVERAEHNDQDGGDAVNTGQRERESRGFKERRGESNCSAAYFSS